MARRNGDEGCVFAFDSHLQIKRGFGALGEWREGERGDGLRLMGMPADQNFKFME